MTSRAPKRNLLLDLLNEADFVEFLNAQTAGARNGDFVGFENIRSEYRSNRCREKQAKVDSIVIKAAAEHWEFVSPLLRKPRNEDDYDLLALALDELLEMTGGDETNPLMSLVDIIGDWIEEWDHKHHPMPEATGAEVLGYMMREHGLTQSDLPGVGPQSVVSEILSGKRQLNLRQIRWLAERFGTSVETFI
jgi:HTH-type transcriptional regulator/antitoxin HigA